MPIHQQRVINILQIAQAAIDALDHITSRIRAKALDARDHPEQAGHALIELYELLPACELSYRQVAIIAQEQQHFRQNFKHNKKQAERQAARRAGRGHVTQSELKVIQATVLGEQTQRLQAQRLTPKQHEPQMPKRQTIRRTDAGPGTGTPAEEWHIETECAEVPSNLGPTDQDLGLAPAEAAADATDTANANVDANVDALSAEALERQLAEDDELIAQMKAAGEIT